MISRLYCGFPLVATTFLLTACARDHHPPAAEMDMTMPAGSADMSAPPDLTGGSGDDHGWSADVLPDGVGVLNAVWGASADDVWAVGDGAVIVHFDGKVWSRDKTVPADVAKLGLPLKGVWVSNTDAKHAWAVGGAGLVLHYDGAQWMTSDVADPVFCFNGTQCQGSLEGVWGANADQVFAVGVGFDLASGVISRYDSNAKVWQHWHRSDSQKLLAITGSSADNLLAVGLTGWHGDGTNWAPVVLPTGAILSSVTTFDKNHGWATSPSGKIYRWDGAAWTVGADYPRHPLYGVFATSLTDVWAVGSAGAAMPAFILHGDGTAWSAEDAPVGSGELRSVFAIENTVFAVGDHTILRRRRPFQKHRGTRA
jgi:hypothetical protein